jgi:type I restriction enzyme M protein
MNLDLERNTGSLHNLTELEDSLWAAADNLRANSKLTSSEYCMPVLGVIFLRHATNRYQAACRQIAEDQAAGKTAKRAPIKADFLKRRALLLPKEARYDELLKLPKGSNLGTALVEAMNAIERDFEPLLNQLPKDYDKFGNDLLEDLLRIFDSEVLRTAAGDLFGRIYEYFLMKFAMQGAQDSGEFFTPPSLVETIVNVIRPDHGIVFDPASGSGGMFVQSSHFIERLGEDTSHCVSFFGQEKTATTIRLACKLAAQLVDALDELSRPARNEKGQDRGEGQTQLDVRALRRLLKDLDASRVGCDERQKDGSVIRRPGLVEQLKHTAYFQRQAHWLLSRFPDA